MNLKDFQYSARRWIIQCFGERDLMDPHLRAIRFYEEAGELAQACGVTREQAHKLVDYTWNRPIGFAAQEVGGVMITLAGLCEAMGTPLTVSTRIELDRVWADVDKIREKNARKPVF